MKTSLLSYKRQKINKIMYWQKLIAFGLFVAALLIIPLSIPWQLKLYKTRSMIAQVEKESQLYKEFLLGINDQIKQSNLSVDDIVAVLDSVYKYAKQNPISDLIKILEVLSKFENKVVLTNIAYVISDSDNKKEFTIAGIAQNRDALLALKDAFEMSGLFEKVELPIKALLKNKEISFTIKLTLKNQ